MIDFIILAVYHNRLTKVNANAKALEHHHYWKQSTRGCFMQENGTSKVCRLKCFLQQQFEFQGIRSKDRKLKRRPLLAKKKKYGLNEYSGKKEGGVYLSPI